MSYTFGPLQGESKVPWKECNVMDERLKFVARLLDGEKMAVWTGWGARIRTWECRYQKPMPYHLATPQRGRFLHGLPGARNQAKGARSWLEQ